jgi:hypothetical protein
MYNLCTKFNSLSRDRAKDFWRNASMDEKDRVYLVYTVFTVGTSSVYVWKITWDMRSLL